MWKRKANNLAHLAVETIAQKHAAAEYAAVHVGLTHKEAEQRFRQYGPNEIVSGKTLSTLGEFLIKFKNPLIIILIFAAGLSAYFGDNAGAIIIVMMILASVILDFVNTVKSERAAEALKARVLTTATVTRDGHAKEIPLREIVLGDVVLL